jgi:hypothetical protein
MAMLVGSCRKYTNEPNKEVKISVFTLPVSILNKFLPQKLFVYCRIIYFQLKLHI